MNQMSLTSVSDSDDVDLFEYFGIIAKRKKLVILTILVCLTAAIVGTSRMTPVYEASIKLLVSQEQVVIVPNQPTTDPYQVVLMNERLTKTFSDVLEGRVVVEKTIGKLGLLLKPSDLLKRINAEPVRDTQIIKLTVKDDNPRRAAQIANTMGDVFSKTVKDLGPSSQAAVVVKVVEPAVAPTEPIQPKPILNAIIAMLAGLITGIGLALLSERLDTSVKNVDDVERLTGLTFLGKIPKAGAKEVLVSNKVNSSLSEAFRSLRTNIHYLNYNKATRVIVVTSPGLNEGKTTVSVNLATVLAQVGHKVLVVDCDLRKPQVGKVLKLANDIGLANLFAGQVEQSGILQPTSHESMHVVTSGPIPPNPAELISSKRMQEFLEEVRETYDFVIIDLPPALAVTDAVMLAPLADGVLLVSSYGRTKKQSVLATKIALEKVGARILGFVVNGAKLDEGYELDYRQYNSEHSIQPTKTRYFSKALFIITALIVLMVVFVKVFLNAI